MDAYKKLVGEGGLLSKITRYIPGYGGYVERESRRNADKLQRDYLSQQLGQFKDKISDINLELTNGMKLDLLGPMDNVANKLEKLMDRIRYADYGYAGFFDTVKINEGELTKIYEFDLNLIEYVHSVGEWITTISDCVENEEDDEKIKKNVKQLKKVLDELDVKFNDREHIITGVKE